MTATANPGIKFVSLLGKLAASPWALSLTSFALTAMLIRSEYLQVF